VTDPEYMKKLLTANWKRSNI